MFAARPAPLLVALVLASAGCFVPDVQLQGKACDRAHSCDVGYACVEVNNQGTGVCLLEDAGR